MMESSFYYKAPIRGNINMIFRKTKNQCIPNSNSTILHLASQLGQTKAVQAILYTHPSLISEVDSNGDSALHLAARGGCTGIVRVLITCGKGLDAVHDLEIGRLEMWRGILRMENKEGDTALHVATRNKHIQVVRMLLEEDPRFEYLRNRSGESPLYIAASRGFHHLVDEIIKACGSPSYCGPDGRTALHGAVICNSKECTRKLLKWRKTLVRLKDNYSRTPLHYAVHLGFANLVSELLWADESIGYIGDKEEKYTALLVAASAGHVSVMKKLISHYPICCDMVNAKGRNVLHIAIERERKNVIKYLIEECPVINSLITQKDVDGNTPLHLLASSNYLVPVNNNLNSLVIYDIDNKSSTRDGKSEIAEELKCIGAIAHLSNVPAPTPVLAPGPAPAPFDHVNAIITTLSFGTPPPPPPPAFHTVSTSFSKLGGCFSFKSRNSDSHDPPPSRSSYPRPTRTNNFPATHNSHDPSITSVNYPAIPSPDPPPNPQGSDTAHTSSMDNDKHARVQKMAENHMLVAALIATVAFTAGFTMPGGYIQSGSSNQGMAVLSTKSVAFQAFIISDTVALLLSTSALFVYFLAANYAIKPKYTDTLGDLAFVGMFLNMLGLVAMVVAFITGTYAVLQPSPVLAIAACVIVSCVFLIYLVLSTMFFRDACGN